MDIKAIQRTFEENKMDEIHKFSEEQLLVHNYHGNNAYHWASSVEALDYVYSREVPLTRNKYGQHGSFTASDEKCAEWFIKKLPNLSDHTDRTGRYCFMVNTTYGANKYYVSLKNEKNEPFFDFSFTTKDGVNVLFYASGDRLKAIKEVYPDLLKSLNPVNKRSEHAVFFCHDADAVTEIIELFPRGVTHCTLNGKNAPFYARSGEILRRMYEHGCDLLRKDAFGFDVYTGLMTSGTFEEFFKIMEEREKEGLLIPTYDELNGFGYNVVNVLMKKTPEHFDILVKYNILVPHKIGLSEKNFYIDLAGMLTKLTKPSLVINRIISYAQEHGPDYVDPESPKEEVVEEPEPEVPDDDEFPAINA